MYQLLHIYDINILYLPYFMQTENMKTHYAYIKQKTINVILNLASDCIFIKIINMFLCN